MKKKRIDPTAPYGIIYALTSTRDEFDYRYVGKTAYRHNHRLNQHNSESAKGNKFHVYNWMRKETNEGYKIKLITLYRIEESDNIYDLEVKWIAKLKEEGYDLCNHTPGGEGLLGYKFSAEQNVESSKRRAIKRYEENPELRLKIADGVKKFREENPERAAEMDAAGAAWHLENPDHFEKHSEFMRKWWDENKEWAAERSKKRQEWYHTRLADETTELPYGGVTFNKQKKLWQARMKNNILGFSKNREDAVAVRKRAEKFILDGGTVEDFKLLIKKTPEEIKESYTTRGLNRKLRVAE